MEDIFLPARDSYLELVWVSAEVVMWYWSRAWQPDTRFSRVL